MWSVFMYGLDAVSECGLSAGISVLRVSSQRIRIDLHSVRKDSWAFDAWYTVLGFFLTLQTIQRIIVLQRVDNLAT